MSMQATLNKQNFHIRYGMGSVTVNVSQDPCRVSPDTLDAIAEYKMHQGYTNKRNPICDVCHTRKSCSGECMC